MTYKKYSSNDSFDTYIYVSVKADIIKKETYDLCDRVFDSKRIYSKNNRDQIEQVVDYLNIIFKEYDIKRIDVRLKSIGEYTSICVINNEVIEFAKKKLTDFGQMDFTYSEDGFFVECENPDVKEYEDESINKIINKSIKTIKDVNNKYNYDLNDNEKKLISIYKEFFGYYPDLSNEEEYNKIQSMMWLLHSKRLLNEENLFGDFTIRYSGKPTSFTLKSAIDNIVPYGLTTEKYTTKIENICNINKVKELGKIITDYTSHYKETDEIFNNIATVSYIVDRVVSSFYVVEDIIHASHNKLTDDQVEEVLEFLDNLNNALQSDNPYDTYKKLENSKVKVKK